MRKTGNNGLKYGTVRTIIKVYIEYYGRTKER